MTEPTAEGMAEELQLDAERRWGAERVAELRATLRRLAEALHTVQGFPVTPAHEPYPSGPMPETRNR